MCWSLTQSKNLFRRTTSFKINSLAFFNWCKVSSTNLYNFKTYPNFKICSSVTCKIVLVKGLKVEEWCGDATFKTNAGTLLFGMSVAFLMFIKRNQIFFASSHRIRHFWIIENNLFFFPKKYLNICTWLFWLNIKIFEASNEKIREFKVGLNLSKNV